MNKLHHYNKLRERYDHIQDRFIDLFREMLAEIEAKDEEIAALKSSSEPAGSISGFNYVDVVGEGCAGWINLFFGDHIIALVKDVTVADSIKAVVEPRRK